MAKKPKAKREPVDVTESFIAKMRGRGKADDACRWFLYCNERAVRSVAHPVLGEVPCCEKHARFAEGR